jgi:hypothetical protein
VDWQIHAAIGMKNRYAMLFPQVALLALLIGF